MNAMDKLFKLLLAAAAALFFTGCYSDYLNPGPARVYTRADFEAKGLEYISVRASSASLIQKTNWRLSLRANWDITFSTIR